ncbi:protein of unknown function DUF4378, partial [Dillenia turbinata]
YMWGIFQILDYHNWHNVKKILAHKKHRRVKRASDVNSNASEEHFYEYEKHEDYADDTLVHGTENSTKTSKTGKRFGKGRIKALLARRMSREKKHKPPILNLSMQPKLLHTYSIHHLEPSDNHLDGSSCRGRCVDESRNTDGKSFTMSGKYLGHELIQEFDKASETLINLNPGDGRKLNKDRSGWSSRLSLNALEIFKVNKDLFLQILHDSDPDIMHCINSLENSDRKYGLTKSGSFPSKDLSHFNCGKPSTLETKLNESWLFPKGEKPSTANLVDDENVGFVFRRAKSMPLVSTDVLSDPERNQEVINRFKDIIKKGAIQSDNQSRNVRNLTARDAFENDQQGHLSSTDREGITEVCNDVGKRRLHRRTMSLHDSMDKYTQLYEISFGKETKASHLSRSLKMRNEIGASKAGCSKRSLSLSELEYPSSLQYEVYQDAFQSGRSISAFLDCKVGIKDDGCMELKPVTMSRTPYATLDVIEECTAVEEISTPKTHHSSGLEMDKVNDGTVLVDDLKERIDDLRTEKGECSEQQDTQDSKNVGSELQSPLPDSVLDFFSEDNITTHAIFPTIEDLQPKYQCIEGQNPFICSMESPAKVGNGDLKGNNQFVEVEVSRKDYAVFNCIKDILELSGFLQSDNFDAWYSQDQPLDPSIFEEMEACLEKESECYGEEVVANSEHHLLFDLINEVLLEIYARSLNYWPNALSSSCHIHPTPRGDHILEEVWKGISWSLISAAEIGQSLDSIMAVDFAKSNGWMNLQLESECVALDLEELIFDELLDEILQS